MPASEKKLFLKAFQSISEAVLQSFGKAAISVEQILQLAAEAHECLGDGEILRCGDLDIFVTAVKKENGKARFLGNAGIIRHR